MTSVLSRRVGVPDVGAGGEHRRGLVVATLLAPLAIGAGIVPAAAATWTASTVAHGTAACPPALEPQQRHLRGPGLQRDELGNYSWQQAGQIEVV